MDLVIVGAPRSGTNMLRDILTSLDHIETWPCDEINYIWRHGNVWNASDELLIQDLTPRIAKFIRARFKDIREKYNAKIVVEKTCANSLRVPFVDSVLPDAKYIFIYRDGFDVTGSAKERWTASLDIPYLLAKARFVPLVDLPIYALRYLWARLYRFLSTEKRVSFWGPSWLGVHDKLRSHSLSEVCALQWKECVDKAEIAFGDMPDSKVLRVRYEEFVIEPINELARILEFIGVTATEAKIERAVANVSCMSIGKGRAALSEQEIEKIKHLVGETLRRYEYL